MHSTKRSSPEQSSSTFSDRPALVSQSTVSSAIKNNNSNTFATSSRRVSDIHNNHHHHHEREPETSPKTPAQEGMATPMHNSNNAPMNTTMNFLEYQARLAYAPPSRDRERMPPPPADLEYVRNPTDGSALLDHKGVPITVDRFLATKPLKGDILSRPGPGGCKLSYLSGEGVTRSLNETFGFDGWNLEIVKTQREDCFKDDKERFHVAYTAQVRVTHKRSGTYKEDCGSGDAIDRNRGSAVANAMKASVTDAMKRAARHFGNKLGNSLYCDKFVIRNAPQNLKAALEMYDKDRAKYNFIENNNKPIEPSGDLGNNGMDKRTGDNTRNDQQFPLNQQAAGRSCATTKTTADATKQTAASSGKIIGRPEVATGPNATTMQNNRTYQQNRNSVQASAGSNVGALFDRETNTIKPNNNKTHHVSAGNLPPNPVSNQNRPHNPPVPKFNHQVCMPSNKAHTPHPPPPPPPKPPMQPPPMPPPHMPPPPPTASEKLLLSDIFGDGKENDLSSLELGTGFVSRPGTSSGRNNPAELSGGPLKRPGSAIVVPTAQKRPNINPYMQG